MPAGTFPDEMTPRDHFAASALQGLLADPNINCELYGTADEQRKQVAQFRLTIAAGCYQWADAMLKARTS